MGRVSVWGDERVLEMMVMHNIVNVINITELYTEMIKMQILYCIFLTIILKALNIKEG